MTIPCGPTEAGQGVGYTYQYVVPTGRGGAQFGVAMEELLVLNLRPEDNGAVISCAPNTTDPPAEQACYQLEVQCKSRQVEGLASLPGSKWKERYAWFTWLVDAHISS